MKRYLRYLSISIFLMLLLIAIPSQAIYNESVTQIDNYQLAWEVFSKANVAIKDIKIQAWGQINNKILKVDELKELYRGIAAELELNEKEPAIQIENEGIINLSIIEEKEKGQTCQLSVQTIPIPGTEGEGATYLAVLITTQDTQYARKTYNKLVGLLKIIGLKEPVGITFSGEMPGITNQAIRYTRINALAGAVNGSYVEGVVQEKYSSICFFTKRAKNSLDIQGEKVNFNIAFCNDKNEEKTYLHVGVPLIYQDY